MKNNSSLFLLVIISISFLSDGCHNTPKLVSEPPLMPISAIILKEADTIKANLSSKFGETLGVPIRVNVEYKGPVESEIIIYVISPLHKLIIARPDLFEFSINRNGEFEINLKNKNSKFE